PAANHRERIGRGKIAATRQLADGFLTRVDQVGIDFRIQRIRPDAEHSVFRLQNHFHPLWDVVCDECRNSDPEVDVVSVAQFLGDALHDPFPLLLYSCGHSVNPISVGSAFAPDSILANTEQSATNPTTRLQRQPPRHWSPGDAVRYER